LFVAPHQYGGAGLPLKVVSALSYGLPVVYSSWLGGAFNFDAPGKNGGMLVQTAKDMADSIARLWTDTTLWYAMHEAALAYASAHFSKRVFRTQVLTGVIAALPR
jgi:glycosyltransferase involved in cell wall biosynthesis